MESKILSLNIGHPAPMEWNGRTIVSSMLKHPVPGPITIHHDHIEENSFAQPIFHGTPDSVLYAYGLESALEFAKRLGLQEYLPGATGETVTLDRFDEFKISVGDVFKFGEVIAQATYPRIPCGKVSFRMQHELGQKAMQECGRSGVYFKILKPGKIHLTDRVTRFEKAEHELLISDVYKVIVNLAKPTRDLINRAKANGALPPKFIEKWESVTN